MKHETRQLAQHAKERTPSGCGTRHGWIAGVCIYCGKVKGKRRKLLKLEKEPELKI